MQEEELARLDGRELHVLDALNYDRPPPKPSHASPHAFVFPAGKTYWVKRTAQRGLVAELVAGRLGAMVGAAPTAQVVAVRVEITPIEATHLVGVGVGVLDQPGMENLRVLQESIPGFSLDPAKLNLAGRVRVLAFQTWLGVGDAQILVDLRNGALASLDHGEWCADPTDRSDPAIVSTPDVADDAGRVKAHVDDAVRRITEVNDEMILDAVSRVPDGSGWNSDRPHRLALARWIAFRRDRLPEVMQRWRSNL